MSKPGKLALKKSWIITIAAVVVLVAVVSFTLFRLFNPSVGFAYYEPAYLPPNVSIKEKRILILRKNVIVGQNFRTEDWVYSISERKAERSIGSADQNYDASSVLPTCNIQTSPGNIQYRICHWIDYGRIDVHEVRFIKGGTLVYSQIPTTLDQQISMKQIDRFVDSFKRKSTVGFPVLRSNGA